MKKYFKSKFFYVITTLALILTITPAVFSSMGLSFVLRDACAVLLTPAQKVFNYAAEGFDGFVSYFYKFDRLVEENNQLREQVSQLSTQLYDAAEMEKMYEWMADYLDMKSAHNDLKLLSATVTGRDSGNYSKVLTLDVGSGAGVSIGMPVITSEGIAGQITEVGYNWSRVTTVVEAGSSVGAYVERTGEAGICTGEFELAKDGLISFDYLPSNLEAQAGDRVLSTGYGSVYPRGLTLGYVESISSNEYTRANQVLVRCAVSFSDISKVMVITSFEQVAD